jgi:hypothetical protein
MQCYKDGSIVEKSNKLVNPYNNNCNKIYNIIYDNPGISTYEIIEMLGWPPNSVTSRLSDLTKGGRICSSGTVMNPKSGRKVHTWMILSNDRSSLSYVV